MNRIAILALALALVIAARVASEPNTSTAQRSAGEAASPDGTASSDVLTVPSVERGDRRTGDDAEGDAKADAEGDAEASAGGEAEASAEGDAKASAEDRADGDPPAGEESGEDETPEASRPDRRIVLDTVYDDRRVGESQTRLIEAELGLVEDEALNRYVTSVAVRLLRHAQARPFEYEFKVVDQAVPNAFALPGGKIYVSRGLLALALNEDELAGVLGHEITHAIERHASARIDYTKRLNPFMIGFLRAAMVADYGRNQELDADRGGQLLAAKAGYDPTAIGDFLRRLDANERYEIGWARLPSYLATHPTSPQRATQISDRATQLEWTPTRPISAQHPDGYYGMIDGLVIGDDPAGGHFDEENRFVHPDLGFSIRFPQGWETANSQQAVRALAPARDAMAELSVVPGPPDGDLEEIVDDFLEREFEGLRVSVRRRQRVRLGDGPGMRIEGRASSPLGGALSFQMTFVRYGGLVYRLSLLTRSGAESRYRGRGRAFARSFRPLDEQGKHSLRVTRLRIARALEDETLEALSDRTRNELELVYTGVLNGLYADSSLDRRDPVKIGIAEPYIPRGDGEREGDEKDPEDAVDRVPPSIVDPDAPEPLGPRARN